MRSIDDTTAPRTADVGPSWGSTLGMNGTQRPRNAAQVAEQFESLLVQKMLESMRASLGGDDLASGMGSDLARNLLDETLSAAVAHAGGLGLAKSLKESLAQSPTTSRNDDTFENHEA